MKSLSLNQQSNRENQMLSLTLPTQREIHAPDLIDFIDLYLDHMSTRLTRGSMTHYRMNLRGFRQWWATHADKYNDTLSPTMFEDFLTWYSSEFQGQKIKDGATPYMIREAAVMLRRVLIWAHKNGAITEDVRSIVPMPHYDYRPTYFPALDEISHILQVPQDDFRIRDTAIMALMASTGCRRGEVSALKRSNIHFFNSDFSSLRLADDHSGWVYFEKAKQKERGRVSIFENTCGLLLKLWLNWMSLGNGRVFTLTPEGIYHAVVKHGAAIDVPQFHPHSFRHAFNDHWIRENAGMGEASDIARRMQLGHAFDRNDTNMYHYVDWRFNPEQPERFVERIRQFYTSPLKTISDRGLWDWSRYPVHT